jgi:hypothetical protein
VTYDQHRSVYPLLFVLRCLGLTSASSHFQAYKTLNRKPYYVEVLRP